MPTTNATSKPRWPRSDSLKTKALTRRKKRGRFSGKEVNPNTKTLQLTKGGTSVTGGRKLRTPTYRNFDFSTFERGYRSSPRADHENEFGFTRGVHCALRRQSEVAEAHDSFGRPLKRALLPSRLVAPRDMRPKDPPLYQGVNPARRR